MQAIKIEIPQYIREVKLSEAQRTKYYEIDYEGHIKAKGKLLLKQYIHTKYKNVPNIQKIVKKQHLAPQYNIMYVLNGLAYENYQDYVSNNTSRTTMSALDFAEKSKGILFNVLKKEPVIANETKAGKPKVQIIRGQDIYSQNVNIFTRNKIMDAIKEQMAAYLRNIEPIITFPVRISMEIHDTIDNVYDRTNGRWDIDNRAYPYQKAFPDILVNGYKEICKPIIKDDDRLHITQPPTALFCPIEDETQRKLVFIIEEDTRPCVQLIKNYKKNPTLEKRTVSRGIKTINLFNTN